MKEENNPNLTGVSLVYITYLPLVYITYLLCPVLPLVQVIPLSVGDGTTVLPLSVGDGTTRPEDDESRHYSKLTPADGKKRLI